VAGACNAAKTSNTCKRKIKIQKSSDTALELRDDAGASDFADDAENNRTPICECCSFMLQGRGLIPVKVRRGGCFGGGCNVDDEHFKPLEVRRDPKYPRHLIWR
jgi:hypothetical protein